MKTLTAIFILLVLGLNLPAQTIIPKGSVWKYLDDGSNQGTSWYSTSFVDSTWSQGAAQLGYGDGDETTVLSYGSSSSNKHITYYFRKTFTAQNTNGKNGIKLEILRDDGAVVYLNGTELVRSNMPAGTITYTTTAAHTVAGSNEDHYYSYEFPSSLLNAGQNLIAVEVHQRSSTSSDMSFDLKLSFCDISAFRKAPYLLYPGENNKMLILWQLKETKSCFVEWGTDTTYSAGQSTTQETGASHIHKILLTGLNPETKYYYRVVCDTVYVKKGDFITGANPSSAKVSFYAYGDTRSYPDIHDSVAKAVLNSISANPASQTFIISSGDMVSNGDNEDDWDNQFFAPEYGNLQKMLATLPYLSTMGNHEGQGLLFAKYFPYPMFVNGQYYYSFDYGPVHFTVIDQFDNYKPGSAQYNWLVNDFSTSTKPWKILVLHKPGWTAGGGHSNSSDVQNYIQPLCVQYGVQFVVAGHNHYYARASVNGVQHITTGGGGAPLYNPNPNKDSIVKVDKSYHYCRFDIDNDTLTFTAVRSDGSVIETFDYHINATGGIKTSSKVLINGVNVYAAQRSIVVRMENNINGKIEVYDTTGRRIYKSKNRSGKVNIPVAMPGVYFVRISVNDITTVKKVVIR
jgi:hypothetical protein